MNSSGLRSNVLNSVQTATSMRILSLRTALQAAAAASNLASHYRTEAQKHITDLTAMIREGKLDTGDPVLNWVIVSFNDASPVIDELTAIIKELTADINNHQGELLLVVTKDATTGEDGPRIWEYMRLALIEGPAEPCALPNTAWKLPVTKFVSMYDLVEESAAIGGNMIVKGGGKSDNPDLADTTYIIPLQNYQMQVLPDNHTDLALEILVGTDEISVWLDQQDRAHRKAFDALSRLLGCSFQTTQ